MNKVDFTDEQKLALHQVNRCCNAVRAALAERDLVEDCCSREWQMAHARLTAAAIAKDKAFRYAYAVGALPKPYWA